MPRKKLIAANWKMYKTIAETEAFARGLKSALATLPPSDLAVFPPFLSLPAAARALNGTGVVVGAQDLFWEKDGAFTGEVSAAMIRDAGGTHVIVGHSERRHVLGDSDEAVRNKLHAALAAELVAVLCVGEKIEQREAGEAESVVEKQLSDALSGIDAAQRSRIIIAYEPVWAIGTGRTATPEDAEAMHRFVRRVARRPLGERAARALRILYGGSVKPANAKSLLDKDDVDGLLIGGASLELESFLQIAAAA